MTILITSTLRKQGPEAAHIRASLRKLLTGAGMRGAEVSVLLAGDRTMRTLNRRYRGMDRTTDVLSFPLREGRFSRIPSRLLGDIVISIPTAARQAKAYGEPLLKEIDRLLVHGLLHLLGYDHEQGAAEARRMETRERRLREMLNR